VTAIVEPGGPVVGAELSADLAAAALDLARRFHNGATLWVISPQWEPHAHHVAVEFVHPVVMGKRALAAVALVGPDPVAQARVAANPGDLVLAIAAADTPAVLDVMRRAPACGSGSAIARPRVRPTTSSGSTPRIPWCPPPADWCCSTTCYGN
jgi:hypothetical protein